MQISPATDFGAAETSKRGKSITKGLLMLALCLAVVWAVATVHGSRPQIASEHVALAAAPTPDEKQVMSSSVTGDSSCPAMPPIGATIQFESQKLPGGIAYVCGTYKHVYIGTSNVPLDDSEFKVVAPLRAAACAVSFESKKYPGTYLYYYGSSGPIYLKAPANVPAEMTWVSMPGTSGQGVTFKSLASGRFLGYTAEIPGSSQPGCPKPQMLTVDPASTPSDEESWTIRIQSPMTGVWFQNNDPKLCMVIRGNAYGGFSVSPAKGIASGPGSWVSGAGFVDTSKSPITGQLSLFVLNHPDPFSFTFDLQSSDTEMVFHDGGSYVKQPNLSSCEGA